MAGLLVKDRKVVIRDRKVVVGVCPECCGACGEGCCGLAVAGLPGVTEPCGFPRVGGVLEQRVLFSASGSFNQSGATIVPPVNPLAPVNYSYTNTFNLSGAYLSPPATFNCGASHAVTDSTPTDLQIEVRTVYRPSGGGVPVVAPNQRYDGRWLLGASGFPGAMTISVRASVANLASQTTIAVARFIDAVPLGQPAWGMNRTLPNQTIGSNSYNWGAVSVTPTYTSGGCLRTVTGSIAQTEWQGTEPNGAGGTTGYIAGFAFGFTITLNTERCCSGTLGILGP